MTIAIQREIPFFEPDKVIRTRRDAWKAAVLRGAYGTDWLPPETVRNIRRIQVAEDGSRVDLWLWTGARIADTCDQIAFSGPMDAIAVEEIVAAVQRRGWTSVAVTGSAEFKHAVALGLAQARPPIGTVNYFLPESDVASSWPGSDSCELPRSPMGHR